MNPKRAVTFILSLILVSFVAKKLVWHINPEFRNYGVSYLYNYSSLNYVHFIVLFMIPAVASFFLYRADIKILHGFYDGTGRIVQKICWRCVEKKETVLLVFLIGFWIFNLMENVFFRTLIEGKSAFQGPFDSYHEGIKLGFLSTVLNKEKILNELFILHGYLVEVVIPYLAYLVAPVNHAVMAYRVIFTFQILACWVGSIWIIWEIANLTIKKEEGFNAFFKFTLFSIVFVVSNGSFLTLEYQTGFVIFQIGLFLFFMRKILHETYSQKLLLTLSFMIGASVPLGLLYSVKYGLVFSVAFLIALFLIFFHREGKQFFFYSGIGVFISGSVLSFFIGMDQIAEMVKMFLYWIEYFPPQFSKPLISDANEHYLWILQLVVGILIICGIQLILIFKESKSFQEFVVKNTHIIILLALSVMVLKVALDCSDKRHFRAISPFNIFLLFSMTVGWLERLEEFKVFVARSYKNYNQIWILIIVFTLSLNMNPNEAFRHVKPYWKYISMDDKDLLAKKGYSYLTAVEEMRSEIQGMECFYTLTSEGIWYYYFNKPSCSRHHALVHVIGKKASNEVVDDLRTKQPSIILFSNYRSNKSFYNSHLLPEIYQFVYQNYRPYKLIGNHWFWKKSPGGIIAAKLSGLDIKRSLNTPLFDNYKGFVTLEGILNLKNIYGLDGVYITPANQETLLAVSVSSSASNVKPGFLEIPWSIEVPMINFSPEIKNFQLWGYSRTFHEKVKIGGEFVIDHSKINIKSNYAR